MKNIQYLTLNKDFFCLYFIGKQRLITQSLSYLIDFSLYKLKAFDRFVIFVSLECNKIFMYGFLNHEVLINFVVKTF